MDNECPQPRTSRSALLFSAWCFSSCRALQRTAYPVIYSPYIQLLVCTRQCPLLQPFTPCRLMYHTISPNTLASTDSLGYFLSIHLTWRALLQNSQEGPSSLTTPCARTKHNKPKCYKTTASSLALLSCPPRHHFWTLLDTIAVQHSVSTAPLQHSVPVS